MKSITACPHCKTQFLVDDDQLNKYNGKVRCGHCLNVFNAIEHMVKSEKVANEKVSNVGAINKVQALENSSAENNIIKSQDEVLEPSAINEAKAWENNSENVVMDSDHEQANQEIIDKTQLLIKDIDIHNIDIELVDLEKNQGFGLDQYQKTTSNLAEPPAKPLPTIQEDFVQKSFTQENAVQESLAQTSSTEKSVVQTNDGLSTNPASSAALQEQPLKAKNSFAEETPQAADSIHEPKSAKVLVSNLLDVEPEFEYLKSATVSTSISIKILVGLLILLLLGQALFFLRHKIAMEYPASKPYLENICATLDCKIDLPKEIQLLSIDDSSIQEDAEYQGVIRLSSTLSNHAAFIQAYPNLEVTLTDTQDQPKLRRVFKPAEYLPEESNLDNGIPANDSVLIDMPLLAGNLKVAGFRILLRF